MGLGKAFLSTWRGYVVLCSVSLAYFGSGCVVGMAPRDAGSSETDAALVSKPVG